MSRLWILATAALLSAEQPLLPPEPPPGGGTATPAAGTAPMELLWPLAAAAFWGAWKAFRLRRG
jgi:hypothetical protein